MSHHVRYVGLADSRSGWPPSPCSRPGRSPLDARRARGLRRVWLVLGSFTLLAVPRLGEGARGQPDGLGPDRRRGHGRDPARADAGARRIGRSSWARSAPSPFRAADCGRLLAVAVVTYVAALVANPLLTGPWMGVLVVALVIGNTVMVARQLDAGGRCRSSIR